MNIAILSTYPPRECGIASFSKDLMTNISACGQEVSIIALVDKSQSFEYPPEVIFEITEDNRDDFLSAAEYVNNADIDAVFIEHEYGIFGGDDGNYVLDFALNLKKPYLLNTHTVLPEPNPGQRSVLSKLGLKAATVVCMSNRSAQLMNKVFRTPMEKIVVLPHGVPIFKEQPRDTLKAAYGLDGREVVTTFGFIGPGKGIELGIRAVASIKDKYPEIVYLVAGETHPNLKKRVGESYRDSLVELIETLDMGKNIKFINRYTSIEELGEVLYMTDIYLTPYPHKNQAVSGTLSYAIGVGRAIVSTPYEYSLEVLSQGRGLIAADASPKALAALIEDILKDPGLKARLEKSTSKQGETMQWPQVGKEYVKILEDLLYSKAERKVF